MLRGNFHTHTVFCDGKNTAREMAEKAMELGFTHLGFSGHMDSEIRMDLAAYNAEDHAVKLRASERLAACFDAVRSREQGKL